MRIFDLAKKIGVKSADIISELKNHKITGKTASSSIDEEMVQVVTKKLSKKAAPAPAAKKTVKKAAAKTEKPAKAKPEKKTTVVKASPVDVKAAQAKKTAEDEAAKKAAEEKKKAEEAAKKAEEEASQKEQAAARKKEDEELREIERQIEEEEKKKKEDEARQIIITEAVTVKEFAEQLNVHVAEIIKQLFIKGTAVTVNQTLGVEVATDVAKEMGYTVKLESAKPEEPAPVIEKKKKEDMSHLPVRPPIVTVMGHVDHGKTSLLDMIRKTKVADKEAGGITQHIGASSVGSGKSRITFLDTPGHEAFTALRARGAQVTDLVVLVVAADDGVMPQTEEAINHSKAAGVPILVAVNKIDKPDAQPDKVRQELTKFGLAPEEWGGDAIYCHVSAKTGEGVDHLLEMIQLQAEVLELHADPKVKATATVIESRLDKSRGPVHSIIVNEGTLKRGDAFVIGPNYGRVRAMVNEKGEPLKEAGPSMPLELAGAGELCAPGETLTVVENDRKARQISQEMQNELREKKFTTQKQHVRLDSVVESIGEGEITDIKLLIKADTQGSVDGVSELLAKLNFAEVRLHVIHSGIGGITETDVMLAAASNAIVIGFNIRPTEKAKSLAMQEEIDLRLYNVIYEITDDLVAAVSGMLKPKIVEKVVGRAEVREVFKVSKIGNISGCMVLDGTVRRNVSCRLVRDSVVVHTGTVSSLRRFKEDVKEVANGYECGIGIDKYNDVKPGDVIELFEEEEVAQTVMAT